MSVKEMSLEECAVHREAFVSQSLGVRRDAASAAACADVSSEQAKLVHASIAQGPLFHGLQEWQMVRDPTCEKKPRSIYSHQVSLPEGFRFAIDPILLNNLEYWGERNPDSVLRRLRTNLEAAHATLSKGCSEEFQEIASSLTGQEEHTDASLSGLMDVPLSEWEADESVTIVFHTLLSSIGVVASCGLRKTMEDTHDCCYLPFPWVQREEVRGAASASIRQERVRGVMRAVFDGHGGEECARLAQQYFKRYLCARIEELCPQGFDLSLMYYALQVATVDFSRSYLGSSGSTANVCLEFNKELWCANLGDSRALLVTSKAEVIQISQDQRPILVKEEVEEGVYQEIPSKEARHVIKRGHFVVRNRVDGVLGIARALGDCLNTSGRSKVTRVTKEDIERIIKRPLEEGENVYLVQGTDGAFDMASSLQIGQLVSAQLAKGHSCARVAADVAKAVLSAGSKDNITLLIGLTSFGR